MIVGISIDCFLTTKIVIPCAVALIGSYSFWPRRFDEDDNVIMMEDKEDKDEREVDLLG